jgi:ketol-acid reductoisomerase
MVKVYYDEDADIADIQQETIALIGYGIQGRAQGHNLRDSGLKVIIGNRDDQFRQRAVEDGFEVYDVAEAARRAEVIVMLIPDEVQAEVYQKEIEPNLAPKKALVFAHGFAIRYNLIDPPKTIDTACPCSWTFTTTPAGALGSAPWRWRKRLARPAPARWRSPLPRKPNWITLPNIICIRW